MEESAVLTLLEQVREHRYDWGFLEEQATQLVGAARWLWENERWDLVQDYVQLLTNYFVYHRPSPGDYCEDEAALEAIERHWQWGYEVLGYGLTASKKRGDDASTRQFLAGLATLAANLGQLFAAVAELGHAESAKGPIPDYFGLVEKHAAEYLSMVGRSEERWMAGYDLLAKWSKQAIWSGQYAASRGLLKMALSVFGEQGPESAVGDCQFLLGQSLELEGQTLEAKKYYHEAEALGRRTAHWNLVGNSLLALARIAAKEGDVRTARDLCEEGLLAVQSLDAPVTTELRALRDSLDELST